VGTKLRHNFHVLLYPADGVWFAHCLELDVLTHGDNPEHAVEMLDDALRVVAYENMRDGRPPFDFRSAPADDWERFRHGEPGSIHVLHIQGERFEDEVTLAPHVARAG